MGNIIPYSKKAKINDKKCPYCNFILSSKKNKNHMKNCIYNPNIDPYAYTIYDIDSEIIRI